MILKRKKVVDIHKMNPLKQIELMDNLGIEIIRTGRNGFIGKKIKKSERC